MTHIFDSEEAAQYQAFSVLVVDDETGMQQILKKALSKWFSKVDCAGHVEQAKELRRTQHYDLIILDINLPGRSGIEWEEAFSDPDHRCDVIFMTGYADLETAISALKLGATDFILKPFNLEQMMQAVKRCMDKRLNERLQYAMQRDFSRHCRTQIIGESAQTRQLKQRILQYAPSRASVLIEGESGTGKELVARGIHEASGRQGPFVPVNCGAIAPDLLESELFGHVSGAFTGARKSREGLFRVANGGTLFLDEIGEMPLAMQTSLLRALEQKSIRPVGSEKEIAIDVRIVAATNRDLNQEVQNNRFREDLFYRLNVLKIELLPLRERSDDLRDLIPFFTRILSTELGIPEPKWAHEDVTVFQDYDWPGNIRELSNWIERCLLLGKPPAHYWREINGQPAAPNGAGLMNDSDADLQGQPEPHLHAFQRGMTTQHRGPDLPGYPNHWTLKDVEKAHIQQLMHLHSGNKSAAARDLGVARKTLERKYKEWGEEDSGYDE